MLAPQPTAPPFMSDGGRRLTADVAADASGSLCRERSWRPRAPRLVARSWRDTALTVGRSVGSRRDRLLVAAATVSTDLPETVSKVPPDDVGPRRFAERLHPPPMRAPRYGADLGE